MNLIDRDALMKKAQSKCGRKCEECDFAQDMDSWCGSELFGVEVLSMPTVDAAPVVHGEWIPTFHEYANKFERCMIADEFHCSQCGVYSKMKSHYCPNCGAKMDGGVNDEQKYPY